MKPPSLLPAIDTAIADGHAWGCQLGTTAEAMLDRRLADLSDEERETLEIDLSPREYVIDYLAKSFPVRLCGEIFHRHRKHDRGHRPEGSGRGSRSPPPRRLW